MPPDAVLDLARVRAAVDRIPSDMDFEAELAKFRDHEFRDPHTDWDATACNWIRRAVDRGDYTKKHQIRWE
jgi:hypothetical protein